MPVWVLFMNLCRLLLAPLLDAHRPRQGLRNARLMEFVKQHKVWYCMGTGIQGHFYGLTPRMRRDPAHALLCLPVSFCVPAGVELLENCSCFLGLLLVQHAQLCSD